MKSPKISLLVDLRPCVGQQTGVGQYTQQLIRALLDNYGDQLDITGFHYFEQEEASLKKIFGDINYIQFGTFRTFLFKSFRKFGVLLPFEVILTRKRFNVILCTDFVSLPSLRRTPTILAVHDLCFEEFPDYVLVSNRKYLQHFVPKAIKRSSCVITISEATKLAIKRRHRTPDEKFLVTYIPPSRSNHDTGVQLDATTFPEKFILFVGTLEPRKNFISLVNAYALLPQDTRKTYGLVLAGGLGWHNERDLEHIKQLKLDGFNIVLAGYVDESTKAALYQKASLFVQPSLYEGFGMPILEAMSYGVPVAVSNIPVFHEVAGNSAAYFDPNDPLSIVNTLENLLNDPTLFRGLVEKGALNLKRFDWADVAESVYERINSFVSKST